jgi:hypothetical protein
MKIRGESGAIPARGGMAGGTSSGRGKLGVSVRSTKVDAGTKKMVNKQNKAASSYRIKDLDQLEKGQKYRADKKLRDSDTKAKQLKKAELTGVVKGAAATVALGAAAKLTAASNDKKKAKPTPKAKPALTKSEKDFLAGQKAKAKITKKTGVYPNTAN